MVSVAALGSNVQIVTGFILGELLTSNSSWKALWVYGGWYLGDTKSILELTPLPIIDKVNKSLECAKQLVFYTLLYAEHILSKKIRFWFKQDSFEQTKESKDSMRKLIKYHTLKYQNV